MATAAKDRRTGEETRLHILEVAARVFAEKGYTASFTDLIEATGLTKGAFYFHFPSKEALALAAFAHVQQRWADAVAHAAQAGTSALEQLEAMLWAACGFVERDPAARCVPRLCFEMGEDPLLRPHLTPFLAMWEDLVAAFLARAQEEGDVRPDVDVRAAARLSVAAWIGMNDISWIASNGADLRERAETFHRIFTAGLR